MKIRSIPSIKKYKSFVDFDWTKFCKSSHKDKATKVVQVKAEPLAAFSAFFGENGSGKSSVCDILKSLSQNREFDSAIPNSVEVEIENGGAALVHKFEKGQWTNGRLAKEDILFFDVDFINKNVHTHGDRTNVAGSHTQNAGRLIIDLDAEANKLKRERELLDGQVVAFKELHGSSLARSFTEKEIEIFSRFEKLDVAARDAAVAAASKDLESKTAGLVAARKLEKKYSEITGLVPLTDITLDIPLPGLSACKELFSREVKERAQAGADAGIKAHFEKHKAFIEASQNQIPEDYRGHACPLCMQPLANAVKVIEFYKSAFDQSYEREKQNMLSDIQTMKEQFATVDSAKGVLSALLATAFNALEKAKTDFEIPGIYALEEKNSFVARLDALQVPAELASMISGLASLRSLDKKAFDVEGSYNLVASYVAQIETIVTDAKALIEKKNVLIAEFKAKYSEKSKLEQEIEGLALAAAEPQSVLDFFNGGKLALISASRANVAGLRELTEKAKKSAEDLADYLANTIPEGVITKMVSILGRFSLNFTLEHVKPAPNTKSYTFSFKVKDNEGKEREFKDGLSEGERQLISLAFFFAINENLANKQEKILVLDDPITSLDAPNLKILSELIYEQREVFSQTLVFTHHPLFFKYVFKNDNVAKFGVLKNKECFGGGFIYFDKDFDLAEEIKMCSEEIALNAQNGTFRPEETALKYGQMLRLATERFIKNELLMWDKERNFEDVLGQLRPGKSKMAKLSDDDLDVITNLYKFCNWSNMMHIDKEAPAALSELMDHIVKFTRILDKART